MDITDRNLNLLAAIDRNTLIKLVNCITVGIKIINYGTIYQISNKPINICYNTEEVDGLILIQSRDRCFLMKMIILQESNAVFQEFKNFYQILTDLKKDSNGTNIIYPRMQPMNISRYADIVVH